MKDKIRKATKFKCSVPPPPPPPPPEGVLPYKRLMGMCRSMGSHFHHLIDWNGVARFRNFLRLNSSPYLRLANVPECLYCSWKVNCSSFNLAAYTQQKINIVTPPPPRTPRTPRPPGRKRDVCNTKQSIFLEYTRSFPVEHKTLP